MAHISFSDGIELQTICDTLCTYIRAGKDISPMIDRIRRRAARIRGKVNGYWRLPPGREVFLKALDAYAALEFGANESLVLGIYEEFTKVLYSIETRCKVAFLLQEETIWPSTQSVYEAMRTDGRFETQLVYIPFSHQNMTQKDHNLEMYRSKGLPVVNYAEYNLSEENPDVVFFAKPYSAIPKPFYISEVEKIVEHTVYIPYGMETNYRLIRYGFQEYLHYRAWRHIVHGPAVKAVGAKYGYRNGENIVVWGHPRADNYLPEKRYEIPEEWTKKIRGRKVICWCPHHTIVPGSECVSTWLQLSEAIFAAMERTPDVAFLWRPHPLLFGAIVNNGYMTQAELDKLIAEKAAKDNIILDRSADYRISFAASDAIITDGTTFSVEYLYTGKPLMLTTADINQFYDASFMEKALYIGRTPKDIEGFIDSIRKGEDPKREARKDYVRQALFVPEEGTVGKYIADHIIEDLVEEKKNGW